MTRQHQNTDIRRKQIVDAARKLIIEYGSEHITIRRIAQEVGLSEGAIYRHFKSKNDIFYLLIEHLEANLIGDIPESTSGKDAHMEMLDKAIKRHLSAIERRRGISFQVIAEIVSLGDRELNEKVSGSIRKYISRLQKLLASGVKAGEIRDDIDLEATAMLLFGMIQGLVNTWALSNYSFDPVKKFEPMWDIFRQAVIMH